jgi:hypothetical protein
MIEKLENFLDRRPYSPRTIACFLGGLTFLLRLPFIFRYDLFFGSDPGICYLMALRILHGDRPFYFYSETHQGAIESYITALFFKLFSPSIPLAAAQSLLLWSVAVALGAYLFIRSTSKFHGTVAGLIAAVGVPYTLIYVSVPYIGYPGSFLITLLVLLQAFWIMEKGPTLFRLFWFGFVIGTGMYVGKQFLPGLAAALSALFLFQTHAYNFRQLFKPLTGFLAVIGFLAGYWPEILYRSTHAHYRDFSGLAGLSLLGTNLEQVPKALMAYFDAQPISRTPTDVYFYYAIPFGGIRVGNALDVLFCAIGLTVLAFTAWRLKRSFSGKNTGLFLVASLILFNIVAVSISRESIGNFFFVRRYLHVSAIAFSLFTGYFFTFCLLKLKKPFFQWALMGLMVFFPLRALADEYALLSQPDSLREFRWAIQDMQQQGFNRGISHYGPNYIMDALSNEQVIIANLDGDIIGEYPDLVSQADKIAVIGYKGGLIEDKMTYNGHVYTRIGAPRVDELIRWVPYRKIY